MKNEDFIKRSGQKLYRRAKKLIPGGKYKTRPSASYHLLKLRAPLGHEVVYRKRKGGPMVKHILQMKKGKGGNPVPYWKPVETSSKKKRISKRSSRSRTKRRTKRRSKRSSRRRSKRRSKRSSRRRSKRSSSVREMAQN